MFAYNRPTHFTAFRLLRRSLTIEIRTQKSVGTFRVYSYSRVFGVTQQQNNQKPTPYSVSISTVFLLLSY